MHTRHTPFHIGLRTLKTAAAVVFAMIIVDAYGATTSKLIFAMLGAMAAVQPTFQESWESFLAQIIGVLFGGVVGILLLMLPISHLMATGIGIILVITLYNVLHIRFSPTLPCFIVVMLCTTPGIQPVTYALGRIWDTAIGLSIGMTINSLVFPYDNSRQIRSTMESLDHDLILFLEDLFDGDEFLPDPEQMAAKLGNMSRQLSIFEKQRFLMHLRRQKRDIAFFQDYAQKARHLVTHMEILCQMGLPGRLCPENRQALEACGATIRDQRQADLSVEKDVVTNYHVRKILELRLELLEVLSQWTRSRKSKK